MHVGDAAVQERQKHFERDGANHYESLKLKPMASKSVGLIRHANDQVNPTLSKRNLTFEVTLLSQSQTSHATANFNSKLMQSEL